MSRPMFRVMALASLVALAGCHRKADAPGEAPAGLNVDPGDGQVTVSWIEQPGLTYWIFFQVGGSVTAAAPGVPLIFDARSPHVVANLVNGIQYSFVMNATNQDSPAGPSTAVVPRTPRPAGAIWDISGVPLGGNTPQNLNGLTFSVITGRIVAVGNLAPGTPPTPSIFAGSYSYTNTSPNPGVSAWTQATSLPAGFASDLSAVTSFGSQFIALGTDGSVLTSTDGNTWTSAASIPSGPARMNGIALGIVSGAGMVVAVGNGGSIFTSTDLLKWTQAVSKIGNDLYSVSFLNGGFVATGAGGALLTSPDASTWTVQNSNTSSALRGAAYGARLTGAYYVVVGDSGTIVTSPGPDLTNWSLSPIVPALLQDLRSITFGSRFVAVGQDGKVAYSDDAIKWSSSSAGSADLAATVFTPAMYVAVGASGANVVSK